VEQLTQTIQIALAPVFLLVAMGSLLNVVTGRLARVVDRSRDLINRHESTEGDEHDRLVRELRIIDRRMDIINWSIALCVACGIVVCLMVAMLILMGSGNSAVACRRVISSCFTTVSRPGFVWSSTFGRVARAMS
jgi:hypothetical protein